MEINAADRCGRIAITGTPRQLQELLARMAETVLQTATAAGCQNLDR